MCSPSSPLTTDTHLRVLESLLSSFPLLNLHSLVRARFLSSTYTLTHVTWSPFSIYHILDLPYSRTTQYLETTGLLITATSPALSESSLTRQHPVGHDCQAQDRQRSSSSPWVYSTSIHDITIIVLHHHALQHPRSSPSPTILLPPQRPWTLTLVHGLLLYNTGSYDE